ncbi:hypothetical protein [Methylobacterium brachiatum]|jgi:hypothetical protein|uniref:hypothetical protein n=1 Tax=Methylobacterium brachiatum TaxID=269660 RepID=UPI00244C7214|nr:hypothetical protein [Methylobacterium brachiatum]MDF2598651.1 hypothetical protein [Methylobacterium brachiatum]MDH2311269.1 hypothetical protein [Methylobacterium brachiatum]
MTTNPVQDIDTRYIRQIQQQQIELALIKAERDTAMRDRDRAQAHSDAMAKLVEALLASLRPYGFSRKRFVFAIRRAARTVPDREPDSLQHAVLFEGSNRILGGQSLGGARL